MIIYIYSSGETVENCHEIFRESNWNIRYNPSHYYNRFIKIPEKRFDYLSFLTHLDRLD